MVPKKSGRKRSAAEGGISRRTILASVPAVPAVIVGMSAAPHSTQAAEEASKNWTQPGDRIRIVRGELKGQDLKPAMLEVGAPQIEAFPYDPAAEVLRDGNRLNRLVTLRLDPTEMDEETRGYQADGVLVYSAICTHRGCTIKSWMPDERNLRCHCHLSQFDALSGGSVIRGPARRSLPGVKLALDEDGYVVATSGFTSPVAIERK